MMKNASQRITAAVTVAMSGLAFACGMSSAFASGKYTKKEAEITATQTSLTKPAQKQTEKKDRPTITADDIFGGVGDKVKSVTDSQIKVLQRLVDTTADNDPEKPELLFRMAELYAEQQRYYNFRARDLDQKIFDAKTAQKKDVEQKLKADQANYQKLENQWLLGAVKKYIAVVEPPGKYASYKRMDEVLFYLAYLLTQVKKEEAARNYFKRLIKDYPESKFLPDAFFAFGEYYFENKDLEAALKFYEKVMKYPDSRVFGYARYKEAWVYYNMGDFKQALATFVDVIKLSQKPGGNKKNKLGLEKEAKKDAVRAYARVGTPDKAWAFFKNIGGDYAMNMLEALGELYNSQGQFQDSIKIFRQLMAIEPKSPKVCNWQTEVMHNTLAYTGSKAHPENVKELQRLAEVYDSYKSNKSVKPSDLEECKDNTANTLRELATVWHKEATKTQDVGTFDLAQYLYKEYIAKFPHEKDAYVMNFYYAELLFKLGSLGNNQKYCDAAPQYSAVVHMDPTPKAKYLKEAAYAAVISWKNCLSIEDSAEDAQKARMDKRAEKKNAGKGKEAVTDENAFAKKDINDRNKKMIEAFDEYIKYVPDAPELVTIKYRKARIYYEANHFEEAAPLFADIAENHKSNELAVYSANLLIDCLNIKKDYMGIGQYVDKFLATAEFQKDQDFMKQLGIIKAQLVRKQIEQTEKDKRYCDAARLYVKLADEHPDDPKVDEVYYNAAVNFEKCGLLGLAIRYREELIKNKPDSANAKKAIYLVGRNYQDIAAFEPAAKNYEDFAAKYPGEKEAPLALNTASFFRRGLGENDASFKDTALFTKNYGGRKEFIDQAAGVNFYEYQIYEQKKDYDGLQKHMQSYLKDWATKGGVDRQIIAHAKIAQILWRQSCTAPNGGVNGACIELIRQRAGGKARVESKAQGKKGKKVAKKKGSDLPKTCGPETKSKVIVHERTPARAKEAMTHYAEVVKLWKAGAATQHVPGKDEAEKNARISDMTYYAAEAKMVEADQNYEKFLKAAIPDKLDFTPPQADMSPAKAKAQKAKVEASTKAFKTYFETKTKMLTDTQKAYQGVILYKNAHWAIAASARIGQLFQDFSGQLYTAPVPKAPPGIEESFFHDAYCDTLVDKAEPVEAKAIDGLSTCLNKSTELSWFNEWSSLCESELNQIKPNEYPLAAEIRAQPGYSTVASDRAEVQTLEITP